MVCYTEQKQEKEELEGPTDQEIEEDYNTNLANGKKNLLCGDYPEAVTCLQLACTLQSQRYGDTSHECADCFYYYGKSLLELARVENGVLGNALKGVPETEDSESEKEEDQIEKSKNIPKSEREQLRQEVEAAMATENEDEGDSQEEEEKECEKKEEGEKCKEDEEGKVEKKDIPEEEVVEAPPSGSKDETAPPCDEEDPDEVSNMQLAWEMIELAKVLYLKKPKSDASQLNVAQCHLLLGELGLEQENYQQSIGDYLECLVIHKEVLPSVDRRLAETHYNLGLAYSFDKRHDNALEHYNAALNVLETRIDFLNEKVDENDRKKENAEETLEECSEIGEIKSIIPGINSKIEDVMVMKKEELKIKNMKGETSSGFKAVTDKVCTVIPIRKSSDSKPEASDISHLVRRKRAMPDDEKNSEKPENGVAINKKSRQEPNGKDEQNGNTANGKNSPVEPESKNEPSTAAELKAKNSQLASEVAMET